MPPSTGFSSPPLSLLPTIRPSSKTAHTVLGPRVSPGQKEVVTAEHNACIRELLQEIDVHGKADRHMKLLKLERESSLGIPLWIWPQTHTVFSDYQKIFFEREHHTKAFSKDGNVLETKKKSRAACTKTCVC